MTRVFKSDAMRRLTKKCKSKRGTTLVELIATVAILAIVTSLSLEAMVIAGEEFRRVEALSECERSVSLFQENVNLYAKNATKIDLVDLSNDAAFGPGSTISDAVRWYWHNRNNDPTNPDPDFKLQDAENDPNDTYIDIFIYRSGEMTYKIVKYDETLLPTGIPFKEIVTFHNIKEIDWVCRTANSSVDTVLLDYAITSPTDFELLYSKKSGDTFDKDKYSSKEGAYSVMTGMVINNMESHTGGNQLRMSEDTSNFSSSVAEEDRYRGHLNFVVIRTVPRVAK